MAFCSNCGNQLDTSAKFCGNCGAPVAVPAESVAAPELEAPVAVAPAEPERVYMVEPAVSVKTKVFGFVGMGLAIGGLFLAIIGVLYTLMGCFAEIGVGFGFSLGIGAFSWPLCILGKIFCTRSQEGGNTSNVCSIGSKLSIAGMIVSGVMMFLGLVDLANVI